MTLSKRAVDWNGHGQPRGGGRGHDRRRPWFPCDFLVSFSAFAFYKECGWGKTHAVCPVKFFLPPKEVGPVFNLYSLKYAPP
jgi:hypothetical protein